jgi:hypothetical protein
MFAVDSGFRNRPRLKVTTLQDRVGLMLDFQVRRRFAQMRRSFATLGFSAAPTAGAPAGARADLMLDESALAPSASERASELTWGGAASEVPSETREAVFRLASAIRREADTLEALAPRARAEARRLAREEADLAAAAEGLGDGDLGAALDLMAPPVAALVADVAATALNVSLAAVRAGASARGFTQAATDVADLARVLAEALGAVEGLVATLEDRSAETATLAAFLRQRGAALSRGRAREPGDLDVAALRRFTLETSGAAARLADGAEDMARTVRALSDALVAAARRSPLGDRRAQARIEVDAPCEVRVWAGTLPGRTRDLSAEGALVVLERPAALSPGQPLSFCLPDTAPITGSVVAVEGAQLRLCFDLRHDANAAAAASIERFLGSARE